MIDALKALLQAAMRRADGEDLAKLIAGWPELWEEVKPLEPIKQPPAAGAISHNGFHKSEARRVNYRFVRRRW